MSTQQLQSEPINLSLNNIVKPEQRSQTIKAPKISGKRKGTEQDLVEIDLNSYNATDHLCKMQACGGQKRNKNLKDKGSINSFKSQKLFQQQNRKKLLSNDPGISSKFAGLEKGEQMQEDSQESVDSSEVYSECFDSCSSSEHNFNMQSMVASKDDTSNQIELFTDPTAESQNNRPLLFGQNQGPLKGLLHKA